MAQLINQNQKLEEHNLCFKETISYLESQLKELKQQKSAEKDNLSFLKP
jgi:hypothetical protein